MFMFSSNDINKFILFFGKGVCPYEHMMNGKSLMKHHFLKKNYFIAT